MVKVLIFVCILLKRFVEQNTSSIPISDDPRSEHGDKYFIRWWVGRLVYKEKQIIRILSVVEKKRWYEYDFFEIIVLQKNLYYHNKHKDRRIAIFNQSVFEKTVL